MKKNASTPTDDVQKPQRFFYILRLWREEYPLSSGWRVSLENAETGQRLGFGTLEELFGFVIDACECFPQSQEPANNDRLVGKKTKQPR